MVNFSNPAVIAQDGLAMSKLWHAMSGLYLWEFCTTLDYEWNVIRGRLPYRRTIWIYTGTRLAILMCVILGLVLLDYRGPMNCQVAYSFAYVASFVSTLAASLLILLRVIAIWNRNKIVMAVAIGIWVIDVAFVIESSVRLRSTGISTQQGCFPSNGQDAAPALIAIFITDVTLLLTMLGGLIRLGQNGCGEFGLTQFLWKQGVIWLLVAIIAEVVPVVFILMNLNQPFDAIFQQPSYIMLAIAATRMHRSLVDFTSRPKEVYNTRPPIPDSKCSNAAHRPSNPMEVAVHVVSEQHWISRTTDTESGISTDGQMREKQGRLCRDDDLERGAYQ